MTTNHTESGEAFEGEVYEGNEVPVDETRRPKRRPKPLTIPTCSACNVTWLPDPTTATGIVTQMSGNYFAAKVIVDAGLPTMYEYDIPVPVQGVLFTHQLAPVPEVRPSTAQLYLYQKISGNLVGKLVSNMQIS